MVMTATRPGAGPPTADQLAEAVERHGGRLERTDDRVRWWLTDPSSAAEETAAHLGLTEARRLYQMRRPLPLDPPIDGAPALPSLDTRAFDPARDVDAWLTINNAAFAWHPDQGGWTRETLERRMAEPWFDLDDFRVAELDGAMAGFCWTKVHPASATEPEPVGEIYVIAVAPGRVGTGLGTALTVAGLDWLWARRHTRVGMLYVEANNAPAIALYRRLGFEVRHTDVAFDAESDAAGSPAP